MNPKIANLDKEKENTEVMYKICVIPAQIAYEIFNPAQKIPDPKGMRQLIAPWETLYKKGENDDITVIFPFIQACASIPGG